MADEIKKLVSARTLIKRDLTTTTSKLSTAIKRQESWSNIETLLAQLDQLFVQFESTHLDLENVFDEAKDLSLDNYKTVNGLSMSEYIADVKNAYEKITEQVLDYHKKCKAQELKTLLNSISRSLEQLNQYSNVLDELPTENNFCPEMADTYSVEID